MDQHARGTLLWVRAFFLAFVAFLTGVVGHVSAAGLLPSPVQLGSFFALSVPACAVFLTRPASTTRVVVMLVVGQTVVHLGLTASAGHHATQRGHAHGHGHDAVGDHGAGAVAASLPVDGLLSDLSAHAPMMAAHLAAATLVGLWLAAGERSVWTLIALASTALLRPLLFGDASSHLAVVPRRPSPAPVPPVAVTSTFLLARTVVRRGPPALLAA